MALDTRESKVNDGNLAVEGDEVIATHDALTRALKRSEDKPDRRDVRAAIVRFVDVYYRDPRRKAELHRRINFIRDECGDPEGQWHCPACGRLWPDDKQICGNDRCKTPKQERITEYQVAVRSAFAAFASEPEPQDTASQLVLRRLDRSRRSHIQTVGALQDVRDFIRQAANSLSLFDDKSRPQFERWHDECGQILDEALKLNVEGCFYLHSVWDADQICPTEPPILSRQFLESLAPAKLDLVACAANSLVEWSNGQNSNTNQATAHSGHLGLRADRATCTIRRDKFEACVLLGNKPELWDVFCVLLEAGDKVPRVSEWERLFPSTDDRDENRKTKDRRRQLVDRLRTELIPLDITIQERNYKLIEHNSRT